MPLEIDDRERDWRRRRFEDIAAGQASDATRMKVVSKLMGDRRAAAPQAVQFLDVLAKDGDLTAFRDALGSWSKKPPYESFGGFGQMFLNQITNAAAGSPSDVEIISSALQAPKDEADAAAKLHSMLGFVEKVKKGAHPAPKRALFVCSFFWSLQDDKAWPCLWNSAERMLTKMGWLPWTDDLVDFYLTFRAQVVDLGDPMEVELALYWFDEHPFVGLDPTLIERCQALRVINAGRVEGEYASEEDQRAAATCVAVMLGEARIAGDAMAEDVAAAVGRSVKVRVPGQYWTETGHYRGDVWVRWAVGDGSPPVSVILWITADGCFVGLHPGWIRDGWYDEARDVASPVRPASLEFRVIRTGEWRVSPEPTTEPHGEFMIGRALESSRALGTTAVAGDVTSAAADAQPVIDALLTAAGQQTSEVVPGDDPLAPLVAAFMDKRGYPIEKDRQQKANREEMARQLAREELPLLDVSEFRIIATSNRYGHPGPQSSLNKTLKAMEPGDFERLLGTLDYLLWDETDDDAVRINRVLDESDLGISGLKDSVILKLLAVTHADRYIPAFPLDSQFGKQRFLKLLDLPLPDMSLSRGERHLVANDALRQRLDPFFPGDPWAQAQFLFWLLTHEEGGGETSKTELDRLTALADELLIDDPAFLVDIVELLRSKGQVVFYGPPGTGKTYLARELAKVLAPDESRRMIVQFHPSTSYEDFFEGYRPESIDGQLSYQLMPGPLALLAQRAEQSPGAEHIMIVDEINRANLPKVLGELLFLLEYRDERIRTVYRPEEAFELPRDLLLIGTMNTADRSIALVDAALRRRFHFIPFFPNERPMAGLLSRWLARAKEPAWVGELVAMVNDELVKDLGGPHLQIGPSYFMQTGLTEEKVARIWRYNIFPFIEDQLFGEPDKIDQYSFDRVLARYRKESGVTDDAGSVDPTGAPAAEGPASE